MGDIADIVGGGTPSTGNQSYWDGDIDWYAPAEIADQIYANSSQKKITGLGYENSSAKMLPPGTVLFTSRAGIGKTAILTRKGCTNQGFQSIVPHRGELDSYFIFSRTEELKRYGELVGAGSTFVEVSGKQMAVMELMMPPTMREQQTIGGFFQQLDHLITLHQRQPFLQSPPDISLIVQLTPPFYTFSWEQRKLASLCEKFTDGDWIESKDQSDFGVRLVQTGNVGVAEYLDKPNNKKWISEDTFDRLHCEEVLPGDILISRLPEPAGRACIVPLLGTKMITAVDCTIVRTAPDMSNKFLVQYLSSQAYFDDVNTCLAGGTRQRISRGNLANFNVPIPVKKSEQDAIGMFFGYLDNLITLHQRKCIFFTGRAGRLISTVNKKRITSSWEQRKLSEITDKVTEKNAGLQYVETFTNSAEFGIISQRDFFDHDIAKLGSLDGYYIVKTEDFVYNPRISTSAPVGPINRNKLGRTGVMSPLYTVFRPHDIDTTYLEYFFKCGYWHSFMNFNGDSGARSDRFSIRDNVFFQMPIPIPDIDEQRKIGELLTCLDNLITLHQRKCALLFSPFQAFISMMFTTSTFSWEQRKLASLCEKFTDGDWIESKDQSDFGVRLVQTGNVGVAEYLDKPNNKKWISEDTFDRLHCEEVLPGDILISRLPEPAGRACIVPLLGTKMITAVDCTIVRTAPDMSNKFLVQYLSSQAYFDDVNTCLAGGTRQRISRGNLANFNVPIPVKKSEQDAIGMFFGYLDNLITLHQRKCIFFTGRAGRLISTVNKKRITSSWEQRKLSEITDKVTEKNAGLQYVETFTNSAEFGIISQRDFFDHDIAKLGSLDGYYIVKTEDFVYNPRISTSAPVGPINRNKLGRTGVMSPLYTVFRPHDIDTTYLEYFFKCGYWHSFMNFNGDSGARSDRFSIRDNVFFQMPIPIPDIDEQRKIGELLTCLDNLITLHQRKPFLMKWRTSDANRNQTNRLVL